VAALGWLDDHLWDFTVGPQRRGLPNANVPHELGLSRQISAACPKAGRTESKPLLAPTPVGLWRWGRFGGPGGAQRLCADLRTATPK
jgi:hypothetical protein